MKKLFFLLSLCAFLVSSTTTFAKPKNKDLKLNRGQLQSSVNKIEKLTDSDGVEDKKGKKGKKDKADKDSKLEKSAKKESRKLLRKALK